MIKTFENKDLTHLNSLGIGAKCDRLVEFNDAGDLKSLFSGSDIRQGAWNVIGGGSNILFAGDYHGTLLHPVSTGIHITADDDAGVHLRAEAGVVWDDLVAWCVERGLWGAENLSHIPGTVGAAPVQNIGAYGSEAGDIIESVEMFDTQTLSVVTLARDHCGFGYRRSVFKETLRGRVVITAVNFLLSRAAAPHTDYGDLRDAVERLGGPTLANIREAVTAIRRAKLPDPEITGNAGSFFKNPTVSAEVADRLRGQYPDIPLYPAQQAGMTKLAAGWLIDKCGWKGRSLGRAGVHDRQALVLVNLGGATGDEILTLAGRIRDEVFAKFGVEIEMEVNVF